MLWVFESWVLRKILGLKREAVTGGETCIMRSYI